MERVAFVAVLAAAVALQWRRPRHRSLRMLFVGFGAVGQKLAEFLCEQKLQSKSPLQVVGIVTGSHGCLIDPRGIDLAHALREFRQNKRFKQGSEMSGVEAATKVDFDVLVELSPLNITQRGEPAFSHIERALLRGKHVVSANKGPLAFNFHRLAQIAQECGGEFLFESCVMDGCPVFNLSRHCLRGATITKIDGILNSTTNIILSAMERGSTFEAALHHAQEAGIAEADPSHDVEGWDAAAKIAALANVLMGANVTPLDVDRHGISGVSPADLEDARKLNKRLRLVCSATREDGVVKVRVGLQHVDLEDEFASVCGAGSVVRLYSDFMTPISIRQRDPTVSDSAYGVLQDLLTLRQTT